MTFGLICDPNEMKRNKTKQKKTNKNGSLTWTWEVSILWSVMDSSLSGVTIHGYVLHIPNAYTNPVVNDKNN